ncbi:hypothetical protein Cgig2_014873 [Carnegiea gigantea]|uniref:Aminotransferase-like plant mobile domain-containing protein n=1 Tax=Carnegiea gigantea TaxID=171969 RepID=A0A9Q1L010_9CARY|nr:hypothetical protein Cgig2_014873 [Carnegiea gigantea]
MKRAPKTTARKKVQFRYVEVEKPVIGNTDLSVIRTKSWTGLLRHRVAPGDFLTLVERLDYEQWSAIMQTGFGGILSVKMKLIPKRLARWLLEKYDPWDNSLNLANGKLLIDEEDSCVEEGGMSKEVDPQLVACMKSSWSMVVMDMNSLLTSSYAISTCIVGNANGTCDFHVLKYLWNVHEIHKYNWCVYAMKCLNDAIIARKKDKSKFFTGSLLFLILFYLDKVKFRGKKVKRSFPLAVNWDTEKVRNKDRDEQLSGEYGRGRIIDRIDYQKIARLAKVDLEMYVQELQGGQPEQGETGEMSTETTTKEHDVYTVRNTMDNVKASYMSLMIQCRSQPQTTDTIGGNDNVTECLALDDLYYYSPDEEQGWAAVLQVLTLESHLKGKHVPHLSVDITPTSVQLQMGVYTVPRESVAVVSSMKKLFEYDHEEEDKKLWIFKEGFKTLTGINPGLREFCSGCTISSPKLDGKEKKSKYKEKNVLQYKYLRKKIT